MLPWTTFGYLPNTNIRNFDDLITEVHSTQKYTLGARRWRNCEATAAQTATDSDGALEGDQEWIYVYNDEASSSFTRGMAVKRDTGRPFDGVIAGAVAKDELIGIAQHTIPAGSWGWILRNGHGYLLSSAAISAQAVVGTAASGKVAATVYDDAAATDTSEKVIGQALEAASGGDEIIRAFINL